MTDDAPRLALRSEPDGFGYLYGEYVAADGEVYKVDIMPPANLWRGDMKPNERLPHPTDWVIHLDGEEIARVRRREDIDAAVTRQLTRPA